MSYYLKKYLPRKEGENYYQKNIIHLPEELVNKNNLEKILFELEKFNFQENNFTNRNISGLVGELFTYNIVLEELKNRINLNKEKIEIKLIKAKKEYIIGNSINYILKINKEHRINIIKKDSKNEKNKFGFNFISEIDGLIQIKTKKEDKNKKEYVILESKTGNINLDKYHIYNDVIIPLKEIYKTRNISYILMGFEDKIFKKQRILKNNVRDIYLYLKSKHIDFYPISFPFTERKFSLFLQEIERETFGNIYGNCIYNEINNTIEIITANGKKIYGKLNDIIFK
jgi:hypothetical protein